jgi:photosystem II stability/assembly factor-like uncharacterized protein
MLKTIVSFIFVLFVSMTIQAQWQRQNVGTDADFRGLDVVNEKVVWASGTKGTVVRTIDGGKTWDVFNVPDAEKLDFRDIEAFDANTAYVLSIGNGESSRIYKTIDGGKSWTLQFKNTNEKAFFDAFACWDANHGIAMSDPVDGFFLLIRTDDGGKTWQRVGEDKMPRAVTGEAAFAASGTCIHTQGKQNVWFVTGGKSARVFRSNNRGLSWFVSETPIINGEDSTGIFSISFRDAMNGIIVGGDYRKPNEGAKNVATTKDGGKSWKLMDNTLSTGYRSCVVHVGKALIAVGTSGSDISYDGGKTWKSLDKENYNSVAVANSRTVWAVGPKGRVSSIKVS